MKTTLRDCLKDIAGWGRCALLVLASAGVLPAWSASLSPGDHEFTVQHGSLTRSYLVRVPPQVAQQGPLPVVLNFHGGGGNARAEKAYTRMDESADREGYIAVYPNGTGALRDRLLTWNAGTCCGSAAAQRVDDVGFVLALLDDLANRTRVDATRVYATGLSNGSMMAYRVAAEAPQRIAAVAGVAGAMTLPRFAPKLAVPVMHIHSINDQRALYDGGLGPAFPMTNSRVFHSSVDSMLKKWVSHNGCVPEAEVTARVHGGNQGPDAGHVATRYRYAPCRDGVEVVHWQLAGPGHVWPGGQRDYLTSFLGASTGVIDANAEIWRFFQRFRRGG